MDWSECSAVERVPERVSGAWVFRGTRVPVSAFFQNLQDGASVSDFVGWFPGVTIEQTRAVLEHVARSARQHLGASCDRATLCSTLGGRAPPFPLMASLWRDDQLLDLPHGISGAYLTAWTGLLLSYFQGVRQTGAEAAMALEKIGPQRLDKLISSHFPSVYLTLLSIIQSVAVAFLVPEVMELLRQSERPYEQAVLLVNGFILIVLVWHVSMKGLLRRLWRPDVVDGTLLFAIGVCECLLVQLTLAPVLWFQVLALVVILAAGINLSAWFRLEKDSLERPDDYATMRKDLLRKTIIPWVLAAALLFFVVPLMARVDCGLKLAGTIVLLWGLIFMIMGKRQRVEWV